MDSLVYNWLLNEGDEKLAKKFKKEADLEPLPPNSPRLADIVKHYITRSISSEEEGRDCCQWQCKEGEKGKRLRISVCA